MKLIVDPDSMYEFDVVVAGGGTTGVFAALAAARRGARVALVEESGFLGGTAACGLPWMAFHCYDEQRLVIRGIPLEVLDRLRAIGGASEFQMDPILESTVFVDPSLLKILLLQMAREAGIKLFLHSLAVEVLKERNAVQGVFIHNRQGCQLLKAAVVIDATDCCNIAVKAGAETARGREIDHKTQVASTIFTVGGVDIDAMIRYFEDNPTQVRPHKLPRQELAFVISCLRSAPLFSIGAFPDLIAQAARDGVDFPRDRMIGIVRPHRGELMLVTPRVEGVDPLSAESFSEGEAEGYRQIPQIMRFVNNYMPGGKRAYIVDIGHTIGMRETTHIIGDYLLTANDLVQGVRFSDAIAIGAYYMDNHTPDHKGLESMIQPPLYTIPYRSLLPRGLEGLLVAGRCVSATHEALSAIRVIPIAGSLGQAAGTAAALAAQAGITPRNVNADTLRACLLEDDMLLS